MRTVVSNGIGEFNCRHTHASEISSRLAALLFGCPPLSSSRHPLFRHTGGAEVLSVYPAYFCLVGDQSANGSSLGTSQFKRPPVYGYVVNNKARVALEHYHGQAQRVPQDET